MIYFRARRHLYLLFAAAALVVSACTPAPPPTQRDVTVAQLHFVLPAGWQKQESTSAMRAYEAKVPGDGGAADFAVFYFGEGKGGDTAANIQRWIDQIEFAPGSDTHREEFSANGMTIFWVNFSGTLKPDSMAPQATERKPNSRLIAAVIEGPHGPWYFKLVGPDATVGPQRDAFVDMLQTVRPAD